MTTLQFSSYAQPVSHAAVGPTGGVAPELVLNADNAGGPKTVAGPAMTLLGPESVRSVDPALFGRRYPADGVTDALDTSLACIEIAAEDLPWRFSPGPAGPNGPAPWLVLVVLEAAANSVQEARPNPTIRARIRELPDLAQSWAWAHVQAGTGSTVARLLCPRRLNAGTAYVAAVVPAFRGGVDAGLGRAPTAATSRAPAWNVADQGELDLPMYACWQFAVGPSGDFADFVGRLAPLAVGEASDNSRLVDVSRPFPADPSVSPAPTIALQGALRPTGPDPAGTLSPSMADALARRLAASIDDEPGDHEAQVAPPLYGGRQAGRGEVVPPPAADDWLAQLNLDARRRLAAGRGAHYVRAHQEELVAKAWDDAGAIRAANRVRAQAELGNRVAQSMYRRHVVPLSVGELVTLSAPARDRLLSARSEDDGVPLAAELRSSRLANGVGSTAFARLCRPAGPTSRAAGSQPALMRSVIARGLIGEVHTRVADTVAERFAMSTERQDTATLLVGAVQAAQSLNRRSRAARTLTSLNVVRVTAAANGHADASAAIAGQLDSLTLDSHQLLAANAPGLPSTLAEALPAASASTVIDATLHDVAGLNASPGTATALAGAGPGFGPAGVRVDAAALRSRLVDALAPEPFAARRAAARAVVPAQFGDSHSLDPVINVPNLPAPLALGLIADGPDWFMPGLQAFPPNRVRLLAANDEFIEAFMVGANHEFNRELLWREYPTDQRGTPFRVFWPRPGGEADIPPIAEFAAGALGTHLSHRAGHLSVLLVRAELLRRFPQTQVFLAPAAGSPGALTLDLDTSSWRAPMFTIPIDQATTAYAFDVDADDLQADARAGAPGWFFMFQEHAYRLRFGFAEAPRPVFTTWTDLSWPQVEDQRGFASVAPLPGQPIDPQDRNWGRDAADTARIALRLPVRIGIHSSALVGR